MSDTNKWQVASFNFKLSKFIYALNRCKKLLKINLSLQTYVTEITERIFKDATCWHLIVWTLPFIKGFKRARMRVVKLSFTKWRVHMRNIKVLGIDLAKNNQFLESFKDEN